MCVCVYFAHRYPIDLFILFYACADSSEWGLFGRCARSAFRRTPSGPETRSQLENDLILPQKAHRSLIDVLLWSPNLQYFFVTLTRRSLTQSWQPQNTIMRLKNSNKTHILRLKALFLTAKMIFSHKILAYISQKLYLCSEF